MWVNSDGVAESPQCYWEYPLLGDRQFDAGAKQEFVDLFDSTIQFHLRADVTVGGFLSGGLDSSSIACFAVRNMTQESYPAFSAILPYHHAENVLIEDVLAKSNQMVPHSFLLDGTDFFEDIRNVIYYHDEPILDGSMYAHYKLCQLSKENGIKVLLSGSGGDELFGGYASHIHSYHATLLSSLRFKKYLQELRKVSRNSDHSYKSLLFKSLYENVSFSARRLLKNKQIQNKHPYLEIQPTIEHYYYEAENRYYANLLNYYKSWTVPPYLHYEDRNSMAFGIETRVPFYDHRLLEFVFQFAPDQVINGRSKSMMRESFKGIVPDKVLQQKGKYGFPSPIDHALRSDQKGRELFFDLYRKAPFLKHKETERVGEEFYKGKGELTTYWRLLSYILWYEIFF
jgi:asparagine synthase (glutamine-hydrolysing)